MQPNSLIKINEEKKQSWQWQAKLSTLQVNQDQSNKTNLCEVEIITQVIPKLMTMIDLVTSNTMNSINNSIFNDQNNNVEMQPWTTFGFPSANGTSNKN